MVGSMSKGKPVWSRALVQAARKVLRHHESLDEALPDIAKVVRIPVTRGSLDAAFRRFSEPTPSSFLKSAAKVALTPKTELLKRVDQRNNARKRREQGITEIIIEKVQAALEKIQPDTIQVVPADIPLNVKGPAEVIWVEVSDVQLGTKVELEKMGGINEHDWRIFLQKLQAWEDGVIKTIKERASVAPIEGVVIALLGDIVEGHQIFKGQVYELDKDVYQQVMHGARDFAQSFARIVATFPDLAFTFYGVGGNHGRVGAYGEAPFRCNWDLVMYQIIQLRLEVLHLPNMVCHFPEAWFQIVETWGWRHLLVHGDDIKGALGLPYYGLQRAMGKHQQVLQMPLNYMHIGHFHAESSISTSVGENLINGNWIGANSFSKIIVEANTPIQMIHGFTEANGLEWSRKVYLRTREDMRPKVDIHKHGARRKR